MHGAQSINQSDLTYRSEEPIPRTIHYAWFGPKRMPDICLRCMDSWQEMAPGYRLKKWSEENFPFDEYPYAKDAMEKGCWAFVSDVARLHALYTEGGIYVDTDVRLIKPLDPLLDIGCFACFEADSQISFGTFGAKRYHPYVKLLLDWYRVIYLRKVYRRVANVRFISKLTRMFCGIELHGKELSFDDVKIFPREYFLPSRGPDGWQTTPDTYANHLYTGLW